MRGTFLKLLTASALYFAPFTSSIQAGETYVYWDFDEGFTPSTVVVAPGDKVTWVNADLYGFDVTISVDGYFPFTLEPYEGVYGIFDTLGAYGMSSDWGDSGMIVVKYPPTIVITNPVNNAVLSAPATFEVKTRTSNDVTSVTFYLDSGLGPEWRETDYEAPFTHGITNLPPGNHTITATANDGYTDVSDMIQITVSGVAPVITLGNPHFSAGKFLFEINGLTPGRTHMLQHSTNCADWTSISTNVAEATARTITNTPSASWRFYRVLELPASEP